MKNIYIVGFMGTGKTVVGKGLASQLSKQFLDIDCLIEDRQKRKISQIFAKEGEIYFRKIEKQILKEISLKQDQVVACGGGIVLDKENIQTMKNTGFMICLTCRSEVILERTQGFRHRPLLNVDNPKEKVEELLKARACFYAQADYTIDTSDLSISSVINKVMEYVRAEKN